MKTVSILGSSGTIGEKAFEVSLLNNFKIVAISGNKNYQKLIYQAQRSCPEYICVTDEDSFFKVKEALSSTKIKVLRGFEIQEIAKLQVDCCVMAISGNAGIIPTFSTLGNAKRLAIATKEAIISGGHLLLNDALKKGTEIIPIDSEHNAIYQCLISEKIESVDKIILTASGGPFLNFEESALERVRPADALKHPNWAMGQKITIDSATLINKALEIIEAHFLFDIDINKIEALIHPQSIIHGFVKFHDESFKSLLSHPDMTMPISFALNYPKRCFCNLPKLDFLKIGNLNFQHPKTWQQRNINLAYLAVNEQKSVALNFANEKYVFEFLSSKIKFNEIYYKTLTAIEKSPKENFSSLDEILNHNLYLHSSGILS